MAAAQENQERSFEDGRDFGAEAVQVNNRVLELRQRAHALVDRFKDKRYITGVTAEKFRKGADAGDTREAAEGFYRWMEQKWHEVHRKVEGMQAKLDAGLQEGILSDNDRKFLMSALIFNSERMAEVDFMGDVDKIEKKLGEKIERMRRDRTEYDKLKNHPLIRNTGFLKTDAETKIAVPGTREFLALKVPERRALLEKIKEALPKAEAYAEGREKSSDKAMTEKYKELLRDAYLRKIIGGKTAQKFLDGFEKIDHAEKKVWLAEFKDQMARYENFWKDVRSTLRGPALQSMEAIREHLGFTELLQAFGEAKEKESHRMAFAYKQKLDGAIKEGLIGKHTVDAFMNAPDGLLRQDLKEKYRYLDEFDGQMQRYRSLWKEAGDSLGKRERDYLNRRRDEWGYTELRAELDRLKNGGKIPEGETGLQNDVGALRKIKDDEKRAAVLEAEKMIEAGGRQKREGVLLTLRRMFGRKSEDAPDQNYQSKVAAARQKNVANDDREKVKSFEEGKFQQVEHATEGGLTQRLTKVTLNDVKSVDQFALEANRRAFRSREEGGADDLTLAVKGSQGQILELNVKEARALEQHLREKEEEKKKAS